MEKPFILKVKETEDKIVENINNSQLPTYVLKTILQNLYNQIEQIEQKEIQEYERQKNMELYKKTKKKEKESEK